MRITKDMLDQELRPYFGISKIISFIISKNWGAKFLNLVFKTLKGKKLKGYQNEEHYIPSNSTDHQQIRVRIFRPTDTTEPIPAMLYIHGGGYLVGTPEQAAPFFKAILKKRKIAIIAPAYRLSQKHPFPADFNDCYDTLLWMQQNAKQLNIQPQNFIIAGHSAGGGMTAALTLKARDTKDANIAFQMPIYPMIDHRMITESSKMTGAPVWSSENNQFGWKHYLKGLSNQPIPAYASPTLNSDYTDFPPTISFVGDLEPFLDENINYIKALENAGVPTKFKIFENAFHAFETVAPKTTIGKAAHQFQINAFAEFYDQYIK